jgi:hypothetical protein
MAITEIEREAKKQAQINSSFEKWLANPMTRMGMSMIPKSENDDAVRLLLRSAFDAGADAGAGSTAGDFLGAIMESMMKKKDGDAR